MSLCVPMCVCLCVCVCVFVSPQQEGKGFRGQDLGQQSPGHHPGCVMDPGWTWPGLTWGCSLLSPLRLFGLEPPAGLRRN